MLLLTRLLFFMSHKTILLMLLLVQIIKRLRLDGIIYEHVYRTPLPPLGNLTVLFEKEINI